MMPKNEILASKKRPLIGVVGPCGSGKTTLISALQLYGFSMRHIAQEHSYVPSMWQRITNPDILIYLDASFSETVRRRNLVWNQSEYDEQKRRLAHARQHADLYLFTDTLSPEQVAKAVLEFLSSRGIVPPASTPSE